MSLHYNVIIIFVDLDGITVNHSYTEVE